MFIKQVWLDNDLSTPASAGMLNDLEDRIEDLDASKIGSGELVTALTSKADKTSIPVNILDYGADNTGTVSSDSAILSAIAVSKNIYIPPGKFKTNLTLTNIPNLKIAGAGSSSVLHSTTTNLDALKLVDCDDLIIENLRVQGTSGTRDGLHLENCQRAHLSNLYCGGTGRHAFYAQRCFGIVVDSCNAGSALTPGPYPTGLVAIQSGLVLSWDGSAADSGCNSFVINGGVYISGQSQSWAIQIDHADGGLINNPIAELSGGGILLKDSSQIVVNGYYGEANPSDVEYTTGTASVTNGLASVAGASGTAWNTNDGEGHVNAWKNKFIIINGVAGKISTSPANNVLTLQSNWTGPTASAQPYRIQSIDLYLNNTKDSTINMGRGGGAIFLEASSRNYIRALTESIFLDTSSANNHLDITTNRASSTTGRIVNLGAENIIRQANYQTNAMVYGAHLNTEELPANTVQLAIKAAGDTVNAVGIRNNGAYEMGDGSSPRDLAIKRYGAQRLLIDGGPAGGGGSIQMPEMSSDPGPPPSNNGILYFRDNGSGKTQLCVRFPTGAVQVISTEP